MEIVNRKANFSYELVDKYTAGIMLRGTEIKAVREAQVNLTDGYCYFQKGELLMRGVYIGEYKFGNLNNHEPVRVRKLLLTKRELKKLENKVKEKGLTIIPYKMFITERGFAKVEIALARGKKSFDKRHSLKEKELKRQMDRLRK